MEQEFNNVGDFKKFLRQEHESLPDDIPDLFLTRMAAALNDDAFDRIDIERFLRGECEFRENCDLAEDEEGREKKVKAVREEYQRWRDSERWLLLSAATSKDETKQREFELEDFKKCNDIPEEYITQDQVEYIGQLEGIVDNFIGKNKSFNRPMNIVIFGHGSLRCHVEFEEEVEVKSGMLVAKGNVEKQNAKKITVDNDAVINMVYTIAKRHEIGEANRVHFCLFYCYAHVRDTEKMFENFRVITYNEDEEHKNPGSILTFDQKDKKQLVSSENMASRWHPKLRDKEAKQSQAKQSLRDVNLNPASFPEELVSHEGPSVFQANSGDGVDEESVNTTVYTGTSALADDGERIHLVGDSVKNPMKDSEEDPTEDDTESERTVTSGSYGDTGATGCSKTKTGAGEIKQEESPEPGYVCYDGGSALELIRANERGRDATETMRSYQKEQGIVTGIGETPTVEVTAGNPGGDSQQPQENSPPNPRRQGWVFRAWGRVTNALSYIDWYPHM